MCSSSASVFLHFFMEQGDSVRASTHPRAAGQSMCYVIHFIGLLPPDAQSQGHLCKLNPTGFLCLHYLDKYFSLHLNYVDQAYFTISPPVHRGQNSICCPQKSSVYLTPRHRQKRKRRLMPYLPSTNKEDGGQ